jgi:hypothetical protein
VNARSLVLKVLQSVEVWSSEFVQSDHFAVNYGLCGKIAKGFGDLRESIVEVLVIPRIQNRFAAGLDSDCTVAVEFDFLCGAERYVVLTLRGESTTCNLYRKRHIIRNVSLWFGTFGAREKYGDQFNALRLANPKMHLVD